MMYSFPVELKDLRLYALVFSSYLLSKIDGLRPRFSGDRSGQK